MQLKSDSNSEVDVSVSPKTKHNRLYELDALRGFAALAVVFFHCTMFRPQIHYGFFLGMSGVDLFFIISGFVIFMSLDKSRNGRSFLIARFIRLYPTYWILGTLTFILYFILHRINSPVPYVEISGKQYLVNLTMFQYYFNVPNMSGAYWTLIIELLFYLVIYILFVFKLLKHIVLFGVIFLAASGILFFGISREWLPNYTAWFPLLYHFPLFFMGILFYKIHQNKKLFLKLIPLIVLCLLFQLYIHDYGRATLFMSIYWYATMLGLFVLIFTLFVFGKLGFIVNKTTVFLGKISYSLYLIHQPIAYCILVPLLTDEMGMNFWFATLIVAVPSAIFVATMVTFYAEIPLIKFLRKKWLLPKTKD